MKRIQAVLVAVLQKHLYVTVKMALGKMRGLAGLKVHQAALVTGEQEAKDQETEGKIGETGEPFLAPRSINFMETFGRNQHFSKKIHKTYQCIWIDNI